MIRRRLIITAAFVVGLSPVPILVLIMFVSWNAPIWWGFVGLGVATLYLKIAHDMGMRLIKRYEKLRWQEEEE